MTLKERHITTADPQHTWGTVATLPGISSLDLVPLPSAGNYREAYRGGHDYHQERDNQALVLCAHDIDALLGIRRRDTVNVDIASLLKGSDSNEAAASPSQQQSSRPATASGPVSTQSQSQPQPQSSSLPPAPATILPPIIGPVAAYGDAAVQRPGPNYGGGAGRYKRGALGSIMPQSHQQQQGGSTDSPAKKQSKWSAEEDALIIELRGSGMKWDDISKRLPGRSPISCRLHYQNYLERRSEWDEERKNKLARLYER